MSIIALVSFECLSGITCGRCLLVPSFMVPHLHGLALNLG